MEELKKCPLCGGEAKADERYEEWDRQLFLVTNISCVDCGVKVSISEYENRDRAERKAKAITAWNTRKPMDRIVERLDKKVKFVDDKITQKIHWGHQTESDQQFMNGVMYAIGIVKEEM